MRRSDEGKGIYLVALTGYGQAEDRQAVFDAGFDEHLVKPLKRGDLERAGACTPAKLRPSVRFGGTAEVFLHRPPDRAG